MTTARCLRRVLLLGAVILAGCGDRPGGEAEGSGMAADTLAADSASQPLVVRSPWVRVPVVPETRTGPVPPVNTAVYLVLANPTDSTETLVGVETEVADTAEIHSAVERGGVMRMRPMGSVVIPAGGQAVFAPGGMHIMLVGLNHALAVGDSVALHLLLHGGTTVDVTAPVRRSPPQP